MDKKGQNQRINIIDSTFKDFQSSFLVNDVDNVSVVNEGFSNNLKENATITINSDEEQEASQFPSFATSCMPSYLAETWAKAKEILTMKNGIVNMPGNDFVKIVVSFSNKENPRFVKHKEGKICCPCPRFIEEGLCSHTIAVAYQIGHLPRLLAKFSNLTQAAEPLLPKSAGRKPNQKSRKRKAPVMRDVNSMADQYLPTTTFEGDHENDLVLLWMKDEKTTTCYGCGGKFRKLPSDPPPPAPHDVVLKGKEMRMFKAKGTNQLRYSLNRESTFYHPNKSCILKKREHVDKNQIVIQSIEKLGRLHKSQLKEQFGIII